MLDTTEITKIKEELRKNKIKNSKEFLAILEPYIARSTLSVRANRGGVEIRKSTKIESVIEHNSPENTFILTPAMSEKSDAIKRRKKAH